MHQGMEEGCSCRDVAIQLQTHHTSNDGPGPSWRRTLHPTREGCEQDGQVHHPSEEPNDRSHRPSLSIQRHTVLDEQTPANVMAKS